MLNTIKKHGLTLGVFACATTGLVAITHYLTEDTIKEQERIQLLSVLNQVIPQQAHDNELYTSCTFVSAPELGTSEPLPAYIATLDGQFNGLAIEAVAPDGYNGAIKVIVGLNKQGSITGARVLSHQETPGLGDKIDMRITDWMTSFTGKQPTSENIGDWRVRKDGGQFDQFTGATITPRAVVNAVKQATLYANQHIDAILKQPLDCGDTQ